MRNPCPKIHEKKKKNAALSPEGEGPRPRRDCCPDHLIPRIPGSFFTVKIRRWYTRTTRRGTVSNGFNSKKEDKSVSRGILTPRSKLKLNAQSNKLKKKKKSARASMNKRKRMAPWPEIKIDFVCRSIQRLHLY